MKKVVFRVDSGNHIGIGHVMRCLTLAEKLKYKFQVHFVTKNHLGFLHKPIAEHFSLKILEGGVQGPLSAKERSSYENWLGQSPEDDLLYTNQYIKEIGGADLFIVDHYSLDASYEKNIHATFLMVIDDLMNREHFCDLIFDQNITARAEGYHALMKKREILYLMGPKFALLRSEFQALRQAVDKEQFNCPVQNVVVFFGGADEQGHTLNLARSLKPDHLKKYNFTFVQSSTHPDFSSLQDLQKNHPEIRIQGFVEDFAQLMLSADLFIGAGGTTSWERASLGVASALVAVAENQVGNCVELQKTNNIYYLGKAEEMDSSKWDSFFREIVPDTSLWYRCRKNSFI